MMIGSGFLITYRLVLTCAHIFDVILCGTDKVSYSEILVHFYDSAPDELVSLVDLDKSISS